MPHIEPYRLRDGTRRYRARWVGADGLDHSQSFALKKDAERFILEQRRRASLGALYQAPPETFDEFFQGWLDRYAMRVRASTLRRAHEAKHHLEVFDGVKLDEIRPATVEDHVAALAKRAPRQAELTLRLLKQVLMNAKERGHLVDEAVFRVKPPRRDQPEMRFLEWREVETLAANTVAPYGNLVMLAALTGLHQGELFALRDRNLDVDARRPSPSRTAPTPASSCRSRRAPRGAGSTSPRRLSASCVGSCSRVSRTISASSSPLNGVTC
jgi:hypothetical protein